jgi:hypothetical protein
MLLYDDAYASTPAPAGTQGCLVYVGGDTPHPWTDADIARQGVKYLLPTWVRSNMGGTPQADGQRMIAWLRAHKAPAGISTALDLETQVNPGYVIQYGAELHAAGFKVLVYGSKSTLFGNPKLDGYYVADYTGVPHVMAGTVVTQFENTPAFDLDDVASGVVLWDTGFPDPAVPVPGPTPPPGEPMSLTPADLAAIDDKIQHALTVVLYGDSQAAAEGKAVQGHPFNLMQMNETLNEIKAALAAPKA